MKSDGESDDVFKTCADASAPAPVPVLDRLASLADVAVDAELDRAALDDLGEPVIVVDDAGTIVRVNKEAEMFTGYKRLELIGQLVEVLVPEMSRSAHIKHRERYTAYPQARQMASPGYRPAHDATAGPDHHTLVLALRTKTGRELPVKISLKPLLVTSGRYHSAVLRLQDEVRG